MPLNESVVLIGVGELGSLFARGFLKHGHPVVPVRRGTLPQEALANTRSPALVLVAVGERDLDAVLSSLPAEYRERVGLLQNELLPRDWARHGILEPTVVVVWFEKKTNRPVTSLLPSAVYGPRSELVAGALEANELPVRRLGSQDELELELVAKNLYILSINLAGLRTGGTVGALRERHAAFFQAVVNEVIELQAALTGRALPRRQLLERLYVALDADPNHVATGRSAPSRLARALEHARALGVAVPTLAALAP
jgi:ketopantoate reductase